MKSSYLAVGDGVGAALVAAQEASNVVTAHARRRCIGTLRDRDGRTVARTRCPSLTFHQRRKRATRASPGRRQAACIPWTGHTLTPGLFHREFERATRARPLRHETS